MKRAAAKREAPDAGFTARPLTPDNWHDLVAVFGGGDGKGDCGRCWCMYWRMPKADLSAMVGRKNKARFKKRVDAGPPPGLVGYDEAGAAVGWVQATPRPDVPGWNAPGRITAPLDPGDADDATIWGISCFVVRAGYRKRGYSAALLDAAIAFARENGAKALDACPVDAKEKRPATALYHGLAPAFFERGFAELARRRPDRPLVRLDLKAKKKTRASKPRDR